MIVQYFVDMCGMDEVSVKLTVSLVLGYPIALIYLFVIQHLPKHMHHIYFFLTGLVIYYWNFGFSILHPIGAILINYSLIHFVPWPMYVSVCIAFVYNTSHLMIGYYHKNTAEYTYDINWTTPHCVLTLRLIGLVWDVYDGKRKEEKLSDQQKKSAIRDLPNILEMMAFCFVPTAYLVGPQFSLAHFRSLVAGTLQPKATYPDGTPRSAIYPKVVRGFLRLLIGVVYIGIYVILKPYFNVETFTTKAFMTEWNFFSRLGYMVIFAKMMLGRYLGVWLMSEGSCVIAGLGCTGLVDPKTGQELPHDACANVHVREYELANNTDHLVNSFNANTNKWMLEYVYKRLRFLGNRYVSQMVTLGYLALWHGLYSGYYVNFFIEFITVIFEKDLLSIVNKSWLVDHLETKPGRIACQVFGMMFIWTILGQPLTAFNLLRFKDWYPVLGTVYFSGFYFLLWPLVRPLAKFILYRKPSPSPPPTAQESSGVEPETKKEN